MRNTRGTLPSDLPQLFSTACTLAVQRHPSGGGHIMDTPLARLSRGATLEEESFAGNLIGGLTQTPKEIACKYFYDETGSRLFDAICELPEYYQTRTETALLARHAGEIAALMGP